MGELIAQNWPNEVNNKGIIEVNDGIPILRISTKAPECAQNLQTTLGNEPLFQFNCYGSLQFE